VGRRGYRGEGLDTNSAVRWLDGTSGRYVRGSCWPPFGIARPLNPGHVRHVHRAELRMELADGLSRPRRRALPLPAAGAQDTPARRTLAHVTADAGGAAAGCAMHPPHEQDIQT
jgi:hypothetical protein